MLIMVATVIATLSQHGMHLLFEQLEGHLRLGTARIHFGGEICNVLSLGSVAFPKICSKASQRRLKVSCL